MENDDYYQSVIGILASFMGQHLANGVKDMYIKENTILCAFQIIKNVLIFDDAYKVVHSSLQKGYRYGIVLFEKRGNDNYFSLKF